MAKQKENTVRAYVFLSENDHKCLQNQAEKEGSNVSALIRRVLREYLAKNNQKPN